MANPSKQKGTGGETELLRRFTAYFGVSLPIRRTSPGKLYDLETHPVGASNFQPIELLATRPDHGEWLVTMRLSAFMPLFGAYEFADCTPLHIEVKRYKRFSLHNIFASKFGRGRS